MPSLSNETESNSPKLFYFTNFVNIFHMLFITLRNKRLIIIISKPMYQSAKDLIPFGFSAIPQFPGFFFPPIVMTQLPITFPPSIPNPLFSTLNNQHPDLLLEYQFQKLIDVKSEDTTNSPFIKSQEIINQKPTISFPIKEKQTPTLYQRNYECQSESEEYRAGARNSKNKKNKIVQNENRNVVPCLVQQVMTFITKQSKSSQICARILKYLNAPQYGFTKNYYNFMRTIKGKQSYYVNAKSLEMLSSKFRDEVKAYSDNQRKFYLKVARTLAKYYLQVRCFSYIYHSKKMNISKKEQQLKARRYILEILQNLEQ